MEDVFLGLQRYFEEGLPKPTRLERLHRLSGHGYTSYLGELYTEFEAKTPLNSLIYIDLRDDPDPWEAVKYLEEHHLDMLITFTLKEIGEYEVPDRVKGIDAHRYRLVQRYILPGELLDRLMELVKKDRMGRKRIIQALEGELKVFQCLGHAKAMLIEEGYLLPHFEDDMDWLASAYVKTAEHFGGNPFSREEAVKYLLERVYSPPGYRYHNIQLQTDDPERVERLLNQLMDRGLIKGIGEGMIHYLTPWDLRAYNYVKGLGRIRSFQLEGVMIGKSRMARNLEFLLKGLEAKGLLRREETLYLPRSLREGLEEVEEGLGKVRRGVEALIGDGISILLEEGILSMVQRWGERLLSEIREEIDGIVGGGLSEAEALFQLHTLYARIQRLSHLLAEGKKIIDDGWRRISEFERLIPSLRGEEGLKASLHIREAKTLLRDLLPSLCRFESTALERLEAFKRYIESPSFTKALKKPSLYINALKEARDLLKDYTFFSKPLPRMMERLHLNRGLEETRKILEDLEEGVKEGDLLNLEDAIKRLQDLPDPGETVTTHLSRLYEGVEEEIFSVKVKLEFLSDWIPLEEFMARLGIIQSHLSRMASPIRSLRDKIYRVREGEGSLEGLDEEIDQVLQGLDEIGNSVKTIWRHAISNLQAEIPEGSSTIEVIRRLAQKRDMDEVKARKLLARLYEWGVIDLKASQISWILGESNIAEL